MLPTPFDLERLTKMHAEEIRSDARKFSFIRLIHRAKKAITARHKLKKEQADQKSSPFFPALERSQEK